MSTIHFAISVSFAIVLSAALTGCRAPQYAWPADLGENHAAVDASLSHLDWNDPDPRSLPMVCGHTGVQLTWTDVMHAADWADIIIIGEQHDDALGHAVQRAMTEDVSQRHQRVALALEMLERDEQLLVDDYFDGIIDAETFARLTHSQSWSGEGSWSEWYQPIIDAAKDGGGRVIAANAPRRYVRLARTHGYERLGELPRERRAMFDLPRPLKDEGYRTRFMNLMSDNDSGHDGTERPGAVAGFRSQLLWDSTMAASIVRARKDGANKVIHLVGQFHSDFNGGTVQQIRARSPRTRILVISMQRDDATTLRDEDRNRADVIIYTGKRPPEPEDDEPSDGQTPNDDESQVDSLPTEEDRKAERL